MDAATKDFTVPSHVPGELVCDIDIYDPPGGRDDPQAAWANIRPGAPLVWSPRNGGHWIATEGEAVFEAYRDARHFSSKVISIPPIEGKDPQLPIEVDAPDHGIYRKNIMPLFTSDAVEGLAEHARELCVELIEEMKPRGECEFVMDFAFRYPLGLFMRMMGLPDEDRMYLRRVTEQYASSPELADKVDALAKMDAYYDEAIQQRIDHPRDDWTTRITQMRYGDRPYTRTEMRSTISLLCAAGLDTVAGMVAFTAHHLALRPDHAAYIRGKLGDTAQMHQIVQELLRRFAIVNMSRQVAEDYVYHGVQMKKGDLIMIPTAVYNMDRTRIEKPEDVDFERANTKHISFGSGPHTCAGALLAREEIRIFLEEWLTRIPEFHIHPDHAPQLRALPLNQVEELWLQWDPAR